MRRAFGHLGFERAGWAIAIALGVAACHPGPATSVLARHALASPAPSPVPAASPSRATYASPSPSPVASVAPSAPPPHTVPLTGTIRLDASYILSNNGGSLIGNNGAGVLAVGDALISDHGGGLISDHGGGIVSDQGGSVISNNGGSLTSKTKRRLLEVPASAAASPAAALPAGTLLPVAGMRVSVRSLATGESVPVARDGAGKPLYSVDSDRDGHYEVDLPDTLAANVLVEARVPDSHDPRLSFGVLAVPGKAVARPVDEDTSVTAAFVRTAAQRRLQGILTARGLGAIDRIIGDQWDVADEVKPPLRQAFQQLRDEAAAAGIDTAPPDRVTATAAAAADAVLAHIALDDLTLDPTFSTFWTGPREPALPAMGTVFAAMRELAAHRLRLDTGFFERQKYLQDANAGRPPASAYQILRPSDLTAFVEDAYLATNDPDAFNHTRDVYDSLGERIDPTTHLDQVDRLEAAVDAVIEAFGAVLLGNTGGGRDEAIARIRALQGVSPSP